jgi:hypothetical protein
MKQLPPKRHYQVQNIIEYIQAKISNLKKKIEEYNSPVMQETLRSSQRMQADFHEKQRALDIYEDLLLVFEKFSNEPAPPENNKTRKR